MLSNRNVTIFAAAGCNAFPWF